MVLVFVKNWQVTFLFHCHVAHHYVAGMWGYWRVYNTHSGQVITRTCSTDVMRPLKLNCQIERATFLRELGLTKLVGKTMNWYGKKFNIVDSGESKWDQDSPTVNIKDWVKYMLPPKGQPGHTDDDEGSDFMAYDGSVWDYDWDGNQSSFRA